MVIIQKMWSYHWLESRSDYPIFKCRDVVKDVKHTTVIPLWKFITNQSPYMHGYDAMRTLHDATLRNRLQYRMPTSAGWSHQPAWINCSRNIDNEESRWRRVSPASCPRRIRTSGRNTASKPESPASPPPHVRSGARYNGHQITRRRAFQQTLKLPDRLSTEERPHVWRLRDHWANDH